MGPSDATGPFHFDEYSQKFRRGLNRRIDMTTINFKILDFAVMKIVCPHPA